MENRLENRISPTPSDITNGSLNAAQAVNDEELKESNAIKDGVLTEEMVSEGLSHFGRDVTGQQQVPCSLSLPSLDLRDISVLCNYVHLQKLELPHNSIKDISCLTYMPHLVILDVSHNEISNFFEFQPLRYLQVANFSHNHIADIKDLEGFLCLRKLNLDYNCLSEISGIEQCSMLTHLSLAFNKIKKISSLGRLPLTHLCLRGNQLRAVEGLENLDKLQVLDLSMNKITSLSGPQNLSCLCSINLEKNKIFNISDLKHVIGLPLLTNINLLDNPVQEQPDFRLRVISLQQQLTMLDQEPVSVKEKVSSVNMFDPPMDVLAAEDHRTHLVYQMGQPQVLYYSNSPASESPDLMLVLTGPEGCGKEVLVRRLSQEFGEYFGVGICHTTRKPYIGEENGIDYHFVSEEDFQSLVHMGKFIQTMQYNGHMFGLTREAIEEVVEDGLVCCVHMELEGVLSLKKTYFEPRYILLIPTQMEKFISHLKSLKLHPPAQIDFASKRVALYINTSEQRPGFFNNIIPCDDWEEAYQTLQQVVKEYLLAEKEEEEGKTNSGFFSVSSCTGHFSAEDPPSPYASETLLGSALYPSPSLFTPSFTNIQAELSPPKTFIELASMRRREQLAREAVAGKRPGLYSQLFKGYDSDAFSASSVPAGPRSTSGMVKPLHNCILEQTTELLKDINLGSRSILPPIQTEQKTLEVPKSPPSPIIFPEEPVEKNKGANVEGSFL